MDENHATDRRPRGWYDDKIVEYYYQFGWAKTLKKFRISSGRLYNMINKKKQLCKEETNNNNGVRYPADFKEKCINASLIHGTRKAAKMFKVSLFSLHLWKKKWKVPPLRRTYSKEFNDEVKDRKSRIKISEERREVVEYS